MSEHKPETSPFFQKEDLGNVQKNNTTEMEMMEIKLTNDFFEDASSTFREMAKLIVIHAFETRPSGDDLLKTIDKSSQEFKAILKTIHKLSKEQK